MLVEFSNPRSLLNPKASQVNEHKVAVVGPRKVGKSALVVRFLTKRFISEYVENTDMPCKRITEVDGEPLRVHIQDTSDKAMRSSVIEQKLRWADAIMMIYSITDADSFRQLKNIATKMTEKAMDLEEKEQSRIPPLVLVGNKGDLDFLRKVSRREGLELAEKLKCDFFEASAREGWSKLIARSEALSVTCSPSAEIDTISLFAGASVAAGMVGLPNQNLSRELTRCLTPTLTRRKSPLANHLSDGGQSSEKTGVKRWGSFHATSRRNLSAPISNHGTFPYNGGRSWNDSPSISDDDCDDMKSSGVLSPTRSRMLNSPSSFIGKLSPRLGRKFHKATNHNEKTTKDDNNNNNNKTRHQSNSIAMGLSSTLLASAKLSETLFCNQQTRNRLSSSSTNSSSIHSHENSASTSASGSMENLTLGDNDMDSSSGSVTPTPGSCETSSSPPNTPGLKELKKQTKLHVQDFSSSEPFLLLCRGHMNRHRRARSPTHKIMSSFKKIRSLAVEHGNNGQSFSKQHAIPSNGQNLLSVPIIKF